MTDRARLDALAVPAVGGGLTVAAVAGCCGDELAHWRRASVGDEVALAIGAHLNSVEGAPRFGVNAMEPVHVCIGRCERAEGVADRSISGLRRRGRELEVVDHGLVAG